MDFDVNKVYSAVNADQLKAGDRVICADNLHSLRKEVERFEHILPLEEVRNDGYNRRFKTEGGVIWNLAYIIEQKPDSPKYRPFKNTEELIKVWGEKVKAFCDEIPSIVKPLIWVRDKHREHDECFIVRYDRADNNIHIAGFGEFSLDSLFECFEFLDGTPCGAKE